MSLVLSEPHPDVDRVILSVREVQNIRADYERLRSINAELLMALRALLDVCDEELDPKKTPEMVVARSAIERAKA